MWGKKRGGIVRAMRQKRKEKLLLCWTKMEKLDFALKLAFCLYFTSTTFVEFFSAKFIKSPYQILSLLNNIRFLLYKHRSNSKNNCNSIFENKLQKKLKTTFLKKVSLPSTTLNEIILLWVRLIFKRTYNLINWTLFFTWWSWIQFFFWRFRMCQNLSERISNV